MSDTSDNVLPFVKRTEEPIQFDGKTFEFAADFHTDEGGKPVISIKGEPRVLTSDELRRWGVILAEAAGFMLRMSRERKPDGPPNTVA